MADNQIIEYDLEADILVVNIKADPKVREDKLLDNDIMLSLDGKRRIGVNTGSGCVKKRSTQDSGDTIDKGPK